MSSLPQTAAVVQWGSCRNVLMILIGLQVVVLIYTGFKAPESSVWRVQDSIQHSAEQGTANWKTGDASDASTTKGVQQVVVTAATEPYDIVPGAYVANYVYERQQPDFRSLSGSMESLQKEREERASSAAGKKLKSCTYYREDGSILTRSKCLQEGIELTAYNGLKGIERTYCGLSIGAETFETIPPSCSNEPVYLFPHSKEQNQFPPIQFVKQDKSNEPLETLEECDVPCQVTMEHCGDSTKGIDCLEEPSTTDWFVRGTDWSFKYFHKVPGMKMDRKAFRQFLFTASQSAQADVQLSEFDLDKFGGPPPAAIEFDKLRKSISLLNSKACDGSSVRADAWARKFQELFELASYGPCVHTTDLPGGMSLDNPDDVQTLQRLHMFALIVEPSLENDFVTAQLYEALLAGIIPVYYGAANVKDHIPAGSIVNANKIGNKEDTAAKLNEIASNKTLWQEYHQWRLEDFPPALLEKFNFAKTDPLCRICQWAYATRYGLGWDHVGQSSRGLELSRDLCTTSGGLITQPFLETWFISSSFKSTTVDIETCENQEQGTQTISHGNAFTVTRSFSVHDNVIDLTVPEITSSGSVNLRLELGIHNWEGSHFANVHRLTGESPHIPQFTSVTIQDARARVTILANWVTTMTCRTNGIVEIGVLGKGSSLGDDEIRKIRVIVEDTNHLRDVKTEYGASPFAKPVILDFMDPLELYYEE